MRQRLLIDMIACLHFRNRINYRRHLKLPILLFSSLLFLTLSVKPTFSFSFAEGTDLGAVLPAGSVFPFNIGTNTVSGTNFFTIFSFQPSFTFDTDVDSFAFSIPAGAQLTQIGFSFSPSFTGTVVSASDQFTLGNGNATPSPALGDQTVDLLGSSPVGVFAAALPLGPGTYGIFDFVRTAGGGPTPTFPFGWTSNYTWSFTVELASASVPEPASALLLLCGIAGLAFRAWRRQ